MDWFKFDPGAFYDGTLSLEPLEVCAYIRLVCLMYRHADGLVDDSTVLSGAVKMSPRQWSCVRRKLIENGKIYPTKNGRLMNERVLNELRKYEKNTRCSGAHEALLNKISGLEPLEEKRREPPLVPQGGQLELISVEDEIETGVTDADVASIWAVTPKEARLRTSREDIRRALVAAFRRGGPPSQVRIALEAYYGGARQIENGRQYAAGAHRIINNDRWKEHYVQALATQPTGPRDPLDTWRQRMREWTTNEWWPGDWGPKPGRIGCEVPAPVLRESGYEPAALAAVEERQAS
jgi:uncharacterized protein YdaU (DUF1376 family)